MYAALFPELAQETDADFKARMALEAEDLYFEENDD